MVSCLTSQFLLSINITPSSLAGVTVSLEETSYTVDEGNGVAVVCAELVEGVLHTNVSVILNTMDNSAVGKSIAYICIIELFYPYKRLLSNPSMYARWEIRFEAFFACM